MHFHRRAAFCRLLGTTASALVAVAAVAPSLAQTTGTTARPVRAYSGVVTPSYGNINAFYGNINAFYGNINAFSGSLSPFYGNINAFWGGLNPYYGNINAFWGNINAFYGNINAFADGTTTADKFIKPSWGNINAFWGGIGPQWGNINAFWGNINAFSGSTPADYANLVGQLNTLIDTSRTFWGQAVQSQTGKSFDDAVTRPMFAKWGIDPTNPASLANISEAGRQRFMLDWYDQLMNYSGSDHVDWWMKAINWNPALTATLGSGVRTKIGILDFSIVGDAGVQDNVVTYDGVSTFSNGHGTAVASLIVAPQDGKGIMGIAPMAQVIAYNPFDSTGTANWTDVTKGVLMLIKNGASVVNMSLGVPGWTFNSGWNDVFTNKDIQKTKSTALFVIAAGNDGVVQTQNVVWDNNNPNFVLVGSVDPGGTISSFSNQPGNACLVGKAGDKCDPKNALMNRFIVAPGEMILVSDGNGGVTRMSGTSFAAPLVSGAITLIHNRWPWLQKDPTTTMEVLLGTAKDLGAPGIDPVYGVGELDVARAVSPLDASRLQWYTPGPGGLIIKVDARTITGATTAQRAQWEANGIYYYLYETIPDTGNFRDFGVPLSTKLFGQSVKSADGTQQQLADYLYKIYVNPGVATPAGPGAPAPGPAVPGFSSFLERGGSARSIDGLNMTMSLAPKSRTYGYVQSTMPYQGSVRLGLPGDKVGVRLGFGDGAVSLGGRPVFGMVTDYDVDGSGANPLLGMASGGAYGNVDVAVTPRLTVSAGYTERRVRRDPRLLNSQDLLAIGGRRQTSQAQHVAVSYRPFEALTVAASLTRLQEDKALLGVRSVDPNDFAAGSATDGVTLGADLALGRGFGLAVTATRGRTRDLGSAYRNLSVADGGIGTSSYELAFAKEHFVDAHDRVRLAVAQPMHVDTGRFDFSSVQVVDRLTGELGVVTQSFAAPGPARQYVGELLYARALGSRGEVSLFGRAQLRRSATPEGTAAVMGGTRFSVAF